MNKRAIAIGLLSGLLFGIATPLNKFLITALNSFELAGLLYLGAAAAFLPFVIRNCKREIHSVKSSSQILRISGVVIFGGFLGPLMLLSGLRLANSSSVSIWLNMELVATAVLGVLVFKDHLDRSAVAGVLLTLAAGILVSVQEGSAGIIPGLFIIGACFCWGIDNHLTALIDGASPRTITFIKGGIAGATNLSIGLITGSQPLSAGIIFSALAVGAVSYGFSIVLYVISAQQLGATRGQILFSTGPFWGILLAFIILSEPVTPFIIISMMLLAGGIFLTNIVDHGHFHKHERIVHVHLHTHDDDHHDHTHEYETDRNTKHSHIHEHEETAHTHKHYPDIHHRHPH